MQASAKILLWVGSTAVRKKFSELQSVLQAQGYTHQWIDVPNACDLGTLEKLAKLLPEGVSGVFWVADLDDVLSAWVENLRNQEVPEIKNLPVMVKVVSQSQDCFERLLDLGVDGLFTINDPHTDVYLRFCLAVSHAQSRLEFEKEIKTQHIALARNETILKQREEFLSVCAHDLRSPLGLIQSSLTLVLNQKNEEPETAAVRTELLTRAKRQTGHALTLVNDLLDVMAFEQGLTPQYQILDLDKLLSDFYLDYKFQAEQKEVVLHYENPVKDWKILADAERCQQLFQNLFTNALKFTERNKNIYLKVSKFVGRRDTDPDYPMVVISVQDEGRGIPVRERQKIFDRFSQIKDYSRSEGRGLGLTVAKQISTLHDGNIWVESEMGKGSTFFVLFPHVISKPKSTSVKSKRIVISEPSLERRELYFDQIKEWGYDVVYVKDGIGAIANASYELPELIVLSGDDTRAKRAEVVNMLRTQPFTARVPIVHAGEVAELADPQFSEIPFDAKLKLSVQRSDLERLLEVFRQARKKSQAA